MNKFDADEDRYKLLLTRTDKEDLNNKVDKKCLQAKGTRVTDNYNSFIKWINEEELMPHDLYESIGKLRLVDIALDRNSDDPQAIFESLNSTGVDLKQADLIRNYILMGLDFVTQKDVYEKFWYPAEELFLQNERKQDERNFDRFFRDYLTMKLGQITKEDEVYKQFISYRNNCQLNASSLCEDIRNYASYYTSIIYNKSNDIGLKTLYQDIKGIGMEVAYPFFLRIHNDCKIGLITPNELRELISLFISYIIRRGICDIPSNTLNKTFADIKNHIRKKAYLASIKQFFISQIGKRKFPNDAEFSSAFIKRDIYNADRCRYILGHLEKWDNKSCVDVNKKHDDGKNKGKILTIDHVLPQNENLSDKWIEDLGSNWSEIQHQYLHTIGNLTLTGFNPEMSDRPFQEKRDMEGGYKQSALRLNKYVIAQNKWGEQQIKERGKKLTELAVKAWLYPQLSSEESALLAKLDAEDKENEAQ